MTNTNHEKSKSDEIGDIIRANTNMSCLLIMDEAHQVMPAGEERAKHIKNLKTKYGGKIETTNG